MGFFRDKVSKTPEKSQTLLADPRGENPDHLYALIRRLGAKVIAMESSASALRRDVNRLERKLSRDTESRPTFSPEAAGTLAKRGDGEALLVPLADIYSQSNR